MSDSEYHFSPELLDLLTDAIWQLERSKPELLDFFRGAGVAFEVLRPHEQQLRSNAQEFKKPIVARKLLERINNQGDAALGARRKIIQRVVEWEDFSTCWPDKRDAAELAVNRVRTLVNRVDSFTRSRDELEAEREKHRAEERRKQREREAAVAERVKLERRLRALSGYTDPVARGKDFETTLNDLFSHEKISVRDPFHVVVDGSVQEQIDGAISVDSIYYLVEIKWHANKLGPDVIGQHMSRLMSRAGTNGLFVSKSGFTPAALTAIRDTLSLRITLCADWNEILYALETGFPLANWIQRKYTAAVTSKQIYLRYGVDFHKDVP